jgi:tetratricopeptide (TPR) repeat protein
MSKPCARQRQVSISTVIPAKAGIQGIQRCAGGPWTPAFAGVTGSFKPLLFLLILPLLTLSGCKSAGAKTDAAQPAAAAAPAAPVPDAVRQSYASALAAMQSGDWPAAQTILQNLAAAHPELPGPAVNLGIVYAHLGRADEARKTLQDAATRFPGFAPGQHQLGLLLSAQGKFADADAAYARAVAADPKYALAYYDRAVLNDLYLQRPQVALQNYEQFQQLQPAPDKQVAGWIDDLRRRTKAAATDQNGGAPHT